MEKFDGSGPKDRSERDPEKVDVSQGAQVRGAFSDVLFMVELPPVPEAYAAPRYLELLDVLLKDPVRAGSKGIVAAIETLQSRKQIQDPFPSAMVQNQEIDFQEFDAELGGQAHYRFSVQKAFGDENLVTAVHLRFRGLSVQAPQRLDSELAAKLLERRDPLDFPWIRINPGQELEVSRELISQGCIVLSASSESIFLACYLKEQDSQIRIRNGFEESFARRVGSLFARSVNLKNLESGESVKARLQVRESTGHKNLFVNNKSGQDIYIFVVVPEEIS